MTGIDDTISELAELWPALPAALRRDTSDGTGSTRAFTAALVVNTDVLTAILTLDRDIPAAVRTACETIHEPWQHRDIPGCLLQVPRLAGRLHDLRRDAAGRTLTWQAGNWLRTVKRALGLRKPDAVIGADCPYAADFPRLHESGAALLAAGDEGFLHRDSGGYRVEWVCTPVIYCVSADCGAEWAGAAQWAVLGRMLEEAGLVAP